eukprot:3590464-Rhodomonas_salina.1
MPWSPTASTGSETVMRAGPGTMQLAVLGGTEGSALIKRCISCVATLAKVASSSSPRCESESVRNKSDEDNPGRTHPPCLIRHEAQLEVHVG